MAFKITYTDGASKSFTDEESYRFSDLGLLLIETEDGRRVTLSPAAWSRIEESIPNSPMAGF